MSYYKKFEIPACGIAPVKNGTADKVNLLERRPIYGITSDAPVGLQFETDYFNTKDTEMLMTDGTSAAKADYTDPAYFHFSRGGGRSIVFQLRNLSAVNDFYITFLRQDKVAVRLPRRVDVYFSANGQDWQRVIKVRDFGSEKETESVTVFANFEHPYKVSYINIEFDVPCHVWIDEIKAIGTTLIPEDAIEITPEERHPEDSIRRVDKYPAYSELCDSHNILLAYNCIPPENMSSPEAGLTTVEQFIPHLGYIDKNGKMTDTFFDSMLFLPYSVYTYSALYKCADGWKYYVDNTFADNANVDALDKATAIVGDKLGIKDLTTKVYLTILHTKVTYGSFPEKFGSFDGGRDLDIDDFEDRRAAIKWCIDTQIAKYNAKERAHLKLCGFYWFEEVINYSDKYELKLLAFAREYVHSLGYKLFWIPYYMAWGYQDWKENGFDVACMQPNYAFHPQDPVKVLYDNAGITKSLGMCYELEIGGLKPENVEKYTQYLDCGAERGFMHSIKMYYQGGVPGEFYRSYISDDPLTRTVYDNTYLFAKEKYVSRGIIKPEDIE